MPFERKAAPRSKISGGPAAFRLASAPETILAVVVRVRQAGYVPAGWTVRSRIDEWMFTAEGPAGALASLEQDPAVQSVALGRSVRPT